MPAQKTKAFATDEDRQLAEEKQIEKRNIQLEDARRYPLKYLRSLQSPSTLKLMEVENDKSAFFYFAQKRRPVKAPSDFMLPLVPDDDRDRSTLHDYSFKLGSDFLTNDVLAKLGDVEKATLRDLGVAQKLEIECGNVVMDSTGDSKRKRPVISSTSTPDFYSPNEVILRYVPSLVANEKNVQFSGSADSLFARLLFKCDLNNLPEAGSNEAFELWSSNVCKKLFVFADEKVNMHEINGLPKSRETNEEICNFALFYTICMPDVQHSVDYCECQGHRLLQQASLSLVTLWIDLTTRLVGEAMVPKVAKLYTSKLQAKDANVTKFEQIVLAPLVEKTCCNSWEPLKDKELEAMNEKGQVYWKLDAEVVTEVVKTWKTEDFSNPSFSFLDANGSRNTQILFVGEEQERAKFGEMFTKANERDAKEYNAASFHVNLKRMSGVFKSVSYILDGKDPPCAIVVIDSETTAASKTLGKRKAKAVAAAATTNGIEALNENLDTSIVEQRETNKLILELTEKVVELQDELKKECKRTHKLAKFVYANLPQNEETEE